MAKKTIIKLDLFAIDSDGWHLRLKCKINGKKCLLTLDGASRTVFDLNKIEELLGKKPKLIEGKLSAGLGTDSMKSHAVKIKEMKLGNLRIPNYRTIAVDLSMLNVSYDKIGEAHVLGVLGSDILTDYNAVINYAKATLTLSKEKA